MSAVATFYQPTARIDDLKTLEHNLADELGGGWLARAVRESIAPEPPVVDQIADLLISGVTGTRLLSELRRRFGASSRGDVFFGVVLAVSLFEADRIGLIHDLMVAETQLAALKPGDTDGR